MLQHILLLLNNKREQENNKAAIAPEQGDRYPNIDNENERAPHPGGTEVGGEHGLIARKVNRAVRETGQSRRLTTGRAGIARSGPARLRQKKGPGA